MFGHAGRAANGAGRRIRDVAKFGRWGVLPHFIFAVVVALTLVFATALPLKRMMTERNRESELRHQVEQTRAESARLQSEIENLTDPAVVEQQARERLGLVRPGETPLVGVDGGLPDPAAGPAPKKPKPTPAAAPSAVPKPTKSPTTAPKPTTSSRPAR